MRSTKCRYGPVRSPHISRRWCTSNMCHGQGCRVGDGHPTFNDGILIMGPYKPLPPSYGNNGSLDPGTYLLLWVRWLHTNVPPHLQFPTWKRLGKTHGNWRPQKSDGFTPPRLLHIFLHSSKQKQRSWKKPPKNFMPWGLGSFLDQKLPSFGGSKTKMLAEKKISNFFSASDPRNQLVRPPWEVHQRSRTNHPPPVIQTQETKMRMVTPSWNWSQQVCPWNFLVEISQISERSCLKWPSSNTINFQGLVSRCYVGWNGFGYTSSSPQVGSTSFGDLQKVPTTKKTWTFWDHLPSIWWFR